MEGEVAAAAGKGALLWTLPWVNCYLWFLQPTAPVTASLSPHMLTQLSQLRCLPVLSFPPVHPRSSRGQEPHNPVRERKKTFNFSKFNSKNLRVSRSIAPFQSPMAKRVRFSITLLSSQVILETFTRLSCYRIRTTVLTLISPLIVSNGLQSFCAYLRHPHMC